MDLIIDFDGIQDSSKQDWLLRTLKLMGIGYNTAEKPQTIDEYNNNDLEGGNAEIEKGNFVTNDQLKKEKFLLCKRIDSVGSRDLCLK